MPGVTLRPVTDPELHSLWDVLGCFVASCCELLPAVAQVVPAYPTCIHFKFEMLVVRSSSQAGFGVCLFPVLSPSPRFL